MRWIRCVEKGLENPLKQVDRETREHLAKGWYPHVKVKNVAGTTRHRGDDERLIIQTFQKPRLKVWNKSAYCPRVS